VEFGVVGAIVGSVITLSAYISSLMKKNEF
jgi:hypothetical protein